MVRLHNLFILTALRNMHGVSRSSRRSNTVNLPTQLVLYPNFVLCLLTCVNLCPAIGTTGSATYYNPPYTPSACFGRRVSGHMVAAASYIIYNRRAICGRRYKVTCLTAAYSKGRNPCKANNVVYVTVVDLCPGCQAQQLDLSREAFASIAGLGAGRIKIYFQPV